MLDERILRRIDVLLGIVAGWFVLTLVVASYALMLFDVAVGLLSLATVVLTAVVAGLSYVRSAGTMPEVQFEVR